MRARLALTLLACASSALAQAPPPAGFPGAPPPSPPAVIREFAADPPTLDAAGGKTTLHWEVLNAYSVAIEPGIGVVATRGAREVVPKVTTTFTLTATGAGGAATRTVTLNVPGTAPEAAPAADVPRGPPPVPRLADGKPDLSGVYAADRNVRLVSEVTPARGAEAFRVTESTERDAGTGADCLPPGVPAVTMLPFPLQIVHTPGVVAILYEAYHQFRVANVNQGPPLGRSDAYLEPTWMGHAFAWWDGDMLAIEARGFNGRTVIAGYRTTEALRVLEYYRRTSYATIAYEAHVTDPNVFEGTLRYSGTLTLHPEWEIGEYVCAENNQDYDELFEAN